LEIQDWGSFPMQAAFLSANGMADLVNFLAAFLLKSICSVQVKKLLAIDFARKGGFSHIEWYGRFCKFHLRENGMANQHQIS